MKKFFTSALVFGLCMGAYAQDEVTLSQLKDMVDANTTNIAALSKFQENFNDEVMVPLNEQFEALQEAIDIVSSDLQGLQEKMRGVATVEAVAELQEAIDIVSSDLQGLMEARRSFATVEAVAEIEEAIDIVSSDLQGLMEARRSFATVEAVAEIEDALEIVSSDLQGLMEARRSFATVEAVAEVEDALEIVSSDLQGLMEARRGFANVEDVVALQEQMEIVSDDLQGLQEARRSFATVEAVAELEEEVATLSQTTQQFMVNFNDEVLVPIQELIDEEHEYSKAAIDWITENGNSLVDLPEAVQANMDAIAVISDDLQGLQEARRSFATVEAVAELEEEVATLSQTTQQFIVNFNDEIMVPIQEAIDAVDVTNEVQGLQESMRGKANVEDVVMLNEAASILGEDVMALSESNMANRTAVNCLINAVNALKDVLAKMGEDVSGIEVPPVLEAEGPIEDPTVEVEAPEAASKAKSVYNLAGQKVSKAQNGVFIVDGVKVKK